VAVTYSWEQAVLGSAGGPRHALALLDAERFLIVNGDTLTDCDLPRLVSEHRERSATVTMAVVAGDVERYGGVLVDDTGRVRGFGRSSPGARALHFVGVQAVERLVFGALEDDQPAETVRELYPALIRRDPAAIHAYVSAAEFLDVGTPADYYETVVHVAARERRSLDAGRNGAIADGATVRDCVLWDRVRIAAGASLTTCVVADDVHVPAGSRFERCALVPGVDGVVAQPFTRR
jgi:NDP-sugar pyrophosphorylase family protein